MTRVPATLRTYVVPQEVLDESRALLREPGEDGYEATIVWIGRVVDDEVAEVVSAIRPRQVASRGPLGCSVEVPPDALTELISAIPDSMFVLARVHTHPGEAYHSELDDTNMLIGHPGAVSIVIPSFARDPLELTDSSVNVLVDGRWVELSPAETAARFRVM